MNKSFDAKKTADLIKILQARFGQNMHRHIDVSWSQVLARLEKKADVLWSLSEMERTGGEPDLVVFENKSEKVYSFYDCAAESPAGRRSLCYDAEALAARKQNKPAGSALQVASQMQIEILDEVEYRQLQQIEKFDRKTSSWIKTPAPIRALGGALFCDRRYDSVFLYHNGADSYYAARGFRGKVSI